MKPFSETDCAAGHLRVTHLFPLQNGNSPPHLKGLWQGLNMLTFTKNDQPGI